MYYCNFGVDVDNIVNVMVSMGDNHAAFVTMAGGGYRVYSPQKERSCTLHVTYLKG